ETHCSGANSQTPARIEHDGAYPTIRGMCDGRMRIARWGFALLLLAAACATKPYDPYRIPVAELRARVHVIALSPIQALATVADREDARTKIEPLVTARLVAGGFEVVPSTEMEERWSAAAAAVGERCA